jgi:hypothetical protein
MTFSVANSIGWQIRSRVSRGSRMLATTLGTFALLTFSVTHAQAQVSVIGNTVEEHTAAPGERYEGSILVRNASAQPHSVRVYQSDYTFFADGTSHFDDAGSIARSNARWIKPSVSSLVIPPSSDVVVTYTVTVPPSDTLRGTYWSALMIEGEVTPPSITNARQIGLGAVVRYAVQLATHLQGTGSRKVRLSSQRLVTDSAGGHSFDLEVMNIGERAYRPSLWVEVYDEAGVQRAKVQQQRGLLYPGTSLLQHFALGNLAPGSYKAVVFADTGDDEVFATQYKLAF